MTNNVNPMYQMFLSGMAPAQQVTPAPMQQMQNLMGPFRQAAAVMQSMQSPAAFVKWQFPDVPDEIAGDPNKVLGYLKQTRNITDEQLSQFASQLPRL